MQKTKVEDESRRRKHVRSLSNKANCTVRRAFMDQENKRKLCENPSRLKFSSVYTSTSCWRIHFIAFFLESLSSCFAPPPALKVQAHSQRFPWTEISTAMKLHKEPLRLIKKYHSVNPWKQGFIKSRANHPDKCMQMMLRAIEDAQLACWKFYWSLDEFTPIDESFHRSNNDAMGGNVY